MEKNEDSDLLELQELALRHKVDLPRKFGNTGRSMYICTANPGND